MMHYSKTAFRNGTEPTIVTKIPAFSEVIGQRMEFSDSDLLKLHRLYNCSKYHTPPGIHRFAKRQALASTNPFYETEMYIKITESPTESWRQNQSTRARKEVSNLTAGAKFSCHNC